MKKIFLLWLIIFSLSFPLLSQSFSAEIQKTLNKTDQLSSNLFLEGKWKFYRTNWGMTVLGISSIKWGSDILILKNPETNHQMPRTQWGELFFGPNYKFNFGKENFTEIGYLTGMETSYDPWVFAVYCLFHVNRNYTHKLIKGKKSGMVRIEKGGSGYRYLAFASCNISESVALGIHAQSDTGIWGPRIELRKKPGIDIRKKTNLTSYLAGGWNFKNQGEGIILGFNLKF